MRADFEHCICRPRRPTHQGRGNTDRMRLAGPDQRQRGLLRCVRGCPAGVVQPGDPPQQATEARSWLRPRRRFLLRGAASGSMMLLRRVPVSKRRGMVADGGNCHLDYDSVAANSSPDVVQRPHAYACPQRRRSCLVRPYRPSLSMCSLASFGVAVFFLTDQHGLDVHSSVVCFVICYASALLLQGPVLRFHSTKCQHEDLAALRAIMICS